MKYRASRLRFVPTQPFSPFPKEIGDNNGSVHGIFDEDTIFALHAPGLRATDIRRTGHKIFWATEHLAAE